jgi:pimeloyl-ACP methyl ester carboxylesterase
MEVVTTTTVTIIAVHGNGGGGFRFARAQQQIPADVTFRAITLPGFADVPADPALRTLRDYAEHLHGVVTEETRPVILLGTGIGGSLLLEYVQHFAGSIDGVILHAPVGARLETRRFPRFMALPGATAFGQWLFSSPITRPLMKHMLFRDHKRIPADYLERFFQDYRRCAVFGQMFEIITAEWYAALKPSPVPAALLWGERERVLEIAHINEYKRLLPNHIVRIVPDWDHFPMIEQPGAYAQEVVTLARELARWKPV